MSLQLKTNEVSLNERIGSDLPTDRMCTAADPIFQRAISEDMVQKVMMKGEKCQQTNVMAHRWLFDALCFSKFFGQMIDTALKTGEANDQERQFLEQMNEGMDMVHPSYFDKYQKIFGKVEMGPMTMAMYIDYMYHKSNVADGLLNGKLLDNYNTMWSRYKQGCLIWDVFGERVARRGYLHPTRCLGSVIVEPAYK